MHQMKCNGGRFRFFQLSNGAVPGVAGEEAENGENFQPAQQHIEDEHQLAQNAEAAEIAGGANGLQTGADVVEAAQHGGEIGACGESVRG